MSEKPREPGRGDRPPERSAECPDKTVADEDLVLNRRKRPCVQDRAAMEQMSRAVGLPVDFERWSPSGGALRILFCDENDLIGLYDALTALDGVRHEPFKE